MQSICIEASDDLLDNEDGRQIVGEVFDGRGKLYAIVQSEDAHHYRSNPLRISRSTESLPEQVMYVQQSGEKNHHDTNLFPSRKLQLRHGCYRQT